MATPKHKTSKSRAASRKAANMKLAAPALSKCENCGNLIAPHKVCPVCGFYKGVGVVETGR
ncbi:MAG TPA: 50S ribosomal protein L32 [Spirochaetaceae bacterium]|nr:50S ribosomal protein L32 [Spirochaetaceae bacterium]